MSRDACYVCIQRSLFFFCAENGVTIYQSIKVSYRSSLESSVIDVSAIKYEIVSHTPHKTPGQIILSYEAFWELDGIIRVLGKNNSKPTTYSPSYCIVNTSSFC
jgi:hypothetical protein